MGRITAIGGARLTCSRNCPHFAAPLVPKIDRMLESNPLPSPKLDTISDPTEQNADVLVVGLPENGSPDADVGEDQMRRLRDG